MDKAQLFILVVLNVLRYVNKIIQMPMSTFCKINSKIILINCLILFFPFFRAYGEENLFF